MQGSFALEKDLFEREKYLAIHKELGHVSIKVIFNTIKFKVKSSFNSFILKVIFIILVTLDCAARDILILTM